MPEYNNYPDYKGYSVTISPLGWRGKYPRQMWGLFGYRVNEKIGLKIIFRPISVAAEGNPVTKQIIKVVHPPIGNEEDVEYWNVDGNGKAEHTTHIIGGSGTIKAYLGENLVYMGPIVHAAYPVFSAELVHKDRVRYDLFLFMVGAIAGAVIGVVLAHVIAQ